MSDVPSITVTAETLDDVRQAFARAAAGGASLCLRGTPESAAWQGPRWLLTLARLAAQETPAVGWSVIVACGDRAGLALAALEAGAQAVAVRGLTPEAHRRLQAIAEAQGARVLEDT